MKKKLMAAMLLLTVQINGMDEVQVLGIPGTLSLESLSIKDNDFPYDRVNELEEYYQSESRKEDKNALQDLDEVFNENARKLFFEQLVLVNDGITNDRALLEFIRSAATSIIKSPDYSNESLMDCSTDSVDESSPDFVYQPPFLFSLVERLDPITWHYIRRVKGQ